MRQAGEDAKDFEARMRQEFLKKENLARLFALVQPYMDNTAPPLVYILTQSERIGHFTIEPQILMSLYGDRYRRIVVITPPLTRPGTNAVVKACFGDAFVWIETDDPVIHAMGFIDGGLADFQVLHMLLQSPRLLIVDFWRKVVRGARPARIALPDQDRERGHRHLRSIGIDPDAPFAFFHMRTMKYREEQEHHGHRTASIERYALSVRRILEAGYQVVRIGERGLEPEGWMADGYVSLPDALPDLTPEERAVDLAVLADAAFGTAQNSGPIWVAAAFGTPTLRTNTPFEHLNLPYNRDLSLFKHYSDRGRRLGYAEILDRQLPAVFRDTEFDAMGIDLEENSAEEIDAATAEFLAMANEARGGLAGAARDRFLALGRAYEDRLHADVRLVDENLDFYGYAHPFGDVASVLIDTDPDFLS
ncbi:MAG: TIGR04372 family glycosyltransferase [Alphaproteobacteria bacterium]|nr:TIGR04372 family glycosyltransferase [Alphaproteobacteria bacterium]